MRSGTLTCPKPRPSPPKWPPPGLKPLLLRYAQVLRPKWPWKPPARSRVVAICLAVTFGAFGAHHFYLRDRQRGFKYLAFCWTLVPLFLALRDAARLVLVDREEFERDFV